VEEKRGRVAREASPVVKVDRARIRRDSQGKRGNVTREVLSEAPREVKRQRNGELDRKKGENYRRNREATEGNKGH
jgi:hypothetical protein